MTIGRRLAAGALALVATFGILAAGAAVARQATVTSPVARAMRLSGVAGYGLAAPTGTPLVRLRLRNGVDLQAVCDRVLARLEPVFGTAPQLAVAGPGQARLQPLLEAVSVPVEQGIATGRFVAMSSAVERMARAQGLGARVEVDARAVYVTLVAPGGRGDAYALFTRSPAPAVAS
jgi:hypothetical protein